jgi:hypothetical protein
MTALAQPSPGIGDNSAAVGQMLDERPAALLNQGEKK